VRAQAILGYKRSLARARSSNLESKQRHIKQQPLLLSQHDVHEQDSPQM
jgi:hypothetical protein